MIQYVSMIQYVCDRCGLVSKDKLHTAQFWTFQYENQSNLVVSKDFCTRCYDNLLYAFKEILPQEEKGDTK